MPSATVLTEGQEREKKGIYVYGKHWNGKGTHIFRLKFEKPELFEKQAAEEAAAAQQCRVPAGFEPYGPEGWLYNKEKNVYFQQATGKRFWWDEAANVHQSLYEGEAWPVSFVGAAVSRAGLDDEQKPQPAPKSIIISDLHAAAKAFRVDLNHFDRPTAVLALVGAASGLAGASADTAANVLPKKLLMRLATNRSEWSDDMLSEAIAGAFDDVAAATGGSMPPAAIALVSGHRILAVAAPGARFAIARALPPPSGSGASGGSGANASSSSSASSSASSSSGGCCSRVDLLPGAAAAPAADEPKVSHCRCMEEPLSGEAFLVYLAAESEARSSACRIVSPSEVRALSDQEFIQAGGCMSHLIQGRPRAASLALANALRAPRPETTDSSASSKASVSVACARVTWHSVTEKDVEGYARSSSSSSQSAKRQKVDEASGKVRLRQILLRYAGTKAATDPVRRKPVKRTVEEAEEQLLPILDALAADGCSSFPSVCKQLSECQSSLKGGDLSGDVGWVNVKEGAAQNKKEALLVKIPDKVLRAAADLAVGELGDLIISDIGVHIIQRTA